MKTEHAMPREGSAGAREQSTHNHPQRRSWLWLVAAFVLCPCHIPILLAIAGTGALGGALARNQALLVGVVAVAFAFALWRYLAPSKTADSCPACLAQRR
jgi:hypothetical protein